MERTKLALLGEGRSAQWGLRDAAMVVEFILKSRDMRELGWNLLQKKPESTHLHKKRP